MSDDEALSRRGERDFAVSSPASGSPRGLGILRADPRRAIGEDSICCLICGGGFRQLTNTHLRAHGVRASEYKSLFGYNRGRPLMCLKLARMYAERAKRAGLAAQIRHRPILLDSELRKRGGARAIALEERLTRREARRREARRRELLRALASAGGAAAG